jgi:hypothetical protein
VRPKRLQATASSYCDWEFEVADPNGHILVFSELIDMGSDA